VPTVLILRASVSQLAAIEQARASGWRVVAVDGDPHASDSQSPTVGEAVDFTSPTSTA